MTPRAVRARRGALSFALSLSLAIASGDVRAADLYRWVTEDGRVEIGTTPPPGAAAAPWIPGHEDAPQTTQPPKAAPASAERARPRARTNDDCARRSEAASKAAREVEETEREIERLERKLETLEASEVAYSRTSCVSDDVYGPSSNCVSTSFHRDTEIAHTERELERAQDKLGDLELRARGSAPPADCASGPTE